MKKKNILSGKKIGFIGVGNMGAALLRGIVDAGKVAMKDIVLCDAAAQKLDQYAQAGATMCGVAEAAQKADILVLAVKPQQIAEILKEIRGKSGKDALIISIAAGVTTHRIEKETGDAAVVRSMPNLPASVKLGVTAIAKGTHAGNEHVEAAKEIFDSVGEVIVVDEGMMDSVTALSGSGPAYLYYFIESMVGAGLNLGFDHETAEKLALGTVRGALGLLDKTKETPEALRRKVTSPGGTTEAAIRLLEEKGFMSTFVAATMRAKNRAEELSKLSS